MPWVEKYRPKTFDGIVLSNDNAALFAGILKNNYIPNMLFYGPPGTGKTTTIINLINAYQARLNQTNQGLMIHLNASDDRGVDVIRTQINAFVGSKTLFGEGVKFVILDEVDYMTKNAQLALTYLLADCRVPVRFILICNYISRIDETLQSMFVKVHFNHLPGAAIVSFLREIAQNEGLTITDDDLQRLQQLYGSDMRSMINCIQTHPRGLAILHDGVWRALYAKVAARENINVLTREVDLICETYRADQPTILKDFLYYIITKEPSFPVATLPALSFALHGSPDASKTTVTYVMLTLLTHMETEVQKDGDGDDNL